MNKPAATAANLPGLEVQAATPAPAKPVEPVRARVKPVDRSQLTWQMLDVELLIEQDQTARAIWALVGRLDSVARGRHGWRGRESGSGVWGPHLACRRGSRTRAGGGAEDGRALMGAPADFRLAIRDFKGAGRNAGDDPPAHGFGATSPPPWGFGTARG